MPRQLRTSAVSSPRLRDLILSDGDRDVARVYKYEHQQDWTWSVFAIVPGRPAAVANVSARALITRLFYLELATGSLVSFRKIKARLPVGADRTKANGRNT
jgi:hypothetical protein